VVAELKLYLGENQALLEAATRNYTMMAFTYLGQKQEPAQVKFDIEQRLDQLASSLGGDMKQILDALATMLAAQKLSTTTQEGLNATSRGDESKAFESAVLSPSPSQASLLSLTPTRNRVLSGGEMVHRLKEKWRLLKGTEMAVASQTASNPGLSSLKPDEIPVAHMTALDLEEIINTFEATMTMAVVQLEVPQPQPSVPPQPRPQRILTNEFDSLGSFLSSCECKDMLLLFEKADVKLIDLLEIEYTQQDLEKIGLSLGAAKRVLKALQPFRLSAPSLAPIVHN
jgi:hypothetical protein